MLYNQWDLGKTRSHAKGKTIAAAKVIVEEAGGKVTDLFGNEQRYDTSIKGAVISNGVEHDEVIKTIKKYLVEL